MLAPITVTSLLDNGDGAKTTLREAIDEANFIEGHDTINFSTNPADGLNGGTIMLSQEELLISDSVTIDASMLTSGISIGAGHGIDQTPSTLDGIRIFNITGGSSSLVTLVGLTLTGADVAGPGGAIYSDVRLVVRDCIMRGNAASSGGGIYVNLSASSVEIDGCTIEDNDAIASGGGIYANVDDESSVVVRDSIVSGNTALGTVTGYGGGGILRQNPPIRQLADD